MDLTTKCRREANPSENANIFSTLVYSFTYGLFRKGRQKSLGYEDVYEPMGGFRSTLLGDRFEELWKSQPTKSILRFFWCLVKLVGMQFIYLTFLLIAINVPLTIARPLLKGKIVSYFNTEDAEVTKLTAFYYAALLACCSFTGTIFFNWYLFAFEQITLKMKIAMCTMLYRKSLKLKSTFISNSCSGQAVTLITKDVELLDFAVFIIPRMFEGSINVIIMIFMMYAQIGVSCFSGVLAVIVFIPFQVFLGKKIGQYRKKTAHATDTRVSVTQEILTAIRIIKMYTWELFFTKSVDGLRRKEISNLRILFYLREFAFAIGSLNSNLGLYITIMTYVSLGNYITAEKAFIVVGCFATMSFNFTYFIPWAVAKLAELGTAINRFITFLNLEEVNESYFDRIDEKQIPNISMKGVEVKSSDDSTILNGITLSLKTGLVLLTGPIGSGKSTFLKMLLGDANKTEGTIEITGRMSYASQEPWLFPGTVRQNIIFNEEFNQKRYEDVIRVCDLQKDFQDLLDGDKTYLADRGLNLSRGQKTRINLARAVYKMADIYLLDDCLSAVDPHVANHIFQKCVKGFLKDKICILVTHRKGFLSEANDIVILNNGNLEFHGNCDSFIKSKIDCFESCIKENNKDYELNDKIVAKESNEIDTIDESSKLMLDIDASSKNVYDEDKEKGSVSKRIYLEYFKMGGGLKMVLLVLGTSILAQVATSWSEYFVSFWVDTERELSGFKFNKTTDSVEFKKLEQKHDSIMIQYSLAIFGSIILTFLRVSVFYILTSTASINIHKAIIVKLINAKMLFFDKNLSGNIINRLSRDLGILDEQLAYTINEVLKAVMTLLGVLFVISTVNTVFIIPSVIVIGLLYLMRKLYLPTANGIRRLEGASRSPIVGQFSATIEGLTTIRASKAESLLSKEFEHNFDIYNSAVHMHISTTRTFSFYVNLICDIYVTVIVFTFVIFNIDMLPGKVGLAITQAFMLTGWLQWGVREWAEFENKMTSAERILEYNKIESENTSGINVNNWPSSGTIVYQDVNLSYSGTDERVLKNINIFIPAKSKIGIVGRTGAGKTSIVSTLFRLYEYDGIISIDDINTKSVTKELLRSKISIIPQDPILFSGTVRSNLDPNNEYTDKQLWDALEEVKLKNVIASLEEKVIEAGPNFSVGQKQLICLARAIIKNNIILALDEATANMDSQTDSLIQKTIKKSFSHCTIITIAHRINTIIDSDKVIVMDSGKVIEFDDPKVLLANNNSTFYKMAQDGGVV